MVWLRSLAAGIARALPGTEGTVILFANGRSSDGGFQRVSAAGGAPTSATTPDSARGRLSGEPRPVAEGVGMNVTSNYFGSFAASAGGVLAYGQGTRGRSSQLSWFDRTGQPQGTASEPDDWHRQIISRWPPLPGERPGADACATGRPGRENSPAGRGRRRPHYSDPRKRGRSRRSIGGRRGLLRGAPAEGAEVVGTHGR